MNRTSDHFIICIAAVVTLVLVAATARADEAPVQRVVWQQAPIAVQLTVGEERRVRFPAPVSVGVPAATAAKLRTQTVNGTVYWLATAPFSSRRVAVRELDSGRVYLLDLQAGAGPGDNAPLEVFVEQAAPSAEGAERSPPGGQIDYVQLTRFAAQQLYAPSRLLTPLPAVVRVPVQAGTVPLVPGAAVTAEPLIAWRAGTLYVTAVKLVNGSKAPQIVDPRTLRGRWLSATFQHARLLPHGDEADTTVVYLISAQPFEASGLH